MASAEETAAASLTPLGYPPGGVASNANGVSGDGSIVVGESQLAAGFGAFYWTAEGGMWELWDLLLSHGVDPAADGWYELSSARVIDLHALRTTLGTNLARAGVAPQLAQRIMRHADYRTTLKHYTVLGLTDTANAIGQIGPIQPTEHEALTGTYDVDETGPKQRPQYSPQLGRNSQRDGAKRRDDESERRGKADDRKSLSDKAPSDQKRSDASQCVKAGDRIRTDDVQLGKLAFYH